MPSGSVQRISSLDNNFTSITISWQPVDCLQQNSPILSYVIRYTETYITTGPITTTDTSFVATSLFPGTSYTFEIAAVNIDGDGPYQQLISSTQPPTGMIILQSFNLIVTQSFLAEIIVIIMADFLVLKPNIMLIKLNPEVLMSITFAINLIFISSLP